jgi:hypothetical protein
MIPFDFDTMNKIELFIKYNYYSMMKIEINKYNMISNSDRSIDISKDLIDIIKIYLYFRFAFDILFIIFVVIKKSRVNALAGFHGVFLYLRTKRGLPFCMKANIIHIEQKNKSITDLDRLFHYCHYGKTTPDLFLTTIFRGMR